MQKTSPEFTLEQFIEASTSCEHWPTMIVIVRTFHSEESEERIGQCKKIAEREITQLHEQSILFGPVIKAYESELCRTTGGAQDHVSAAGESATNGHALALELVKRFRERIWMHVLLETDPVSFDNIRPGNEDQFDPKWCNAHWPAVCDAIRDFPNFDEGQLRTRIRRERLLLQPVGPLVETSDDAILSAVDMAKAFNVDQEKLRKRLDRWRSQNPDNDGWVENENRQKNKPRYLYRVASVRDIIDELKPE